LQLPQGIIKEGGVVGNNNMILIGRKDGSLQVEPPKLNPAKLRAAEVHILHSIWFECLALKAMIVEENLPKLPTEDAAFKAAALKIDFGQFHMVEAAVCEFRGFISSTTHVRALKLHTLETVAVAVLNATKGGVAEVCLAKGAIVKRSAPHAKVPAGRMVKRAMREGAVKKAKMVETLAGEINIVESLVSILRRRYLLNAVV